MAERPNKFFVAIIVFGVLFTGTVNSIVKKVQFGVTVKGYYNWSDNNIQTPHPFNKAWWQTFLMFVGELLCLFGYLIVTCKKKRQFKTPQGFNEVGWKETIYSNRIISWVFILPVLCDTASTVMQSIALLYIDASVWQMLRGSIIVFAGILQVVFLKRKLPCFKWFGMMVVVLGLVLVGVASVFKPNTSMFTSGPGQAALGVGLVLVGSLCTATQMIVEEVFLKKRNYHPLHVVGMEGVYGCILMGLIILPAVQHIPGDDLNGSFENVLDALFQTAYSPVIIATSILMILSIAFFNYFSLQITRYFSAVHRTLLDTLRSISIWITSIILYYAADPLYGEPVNSGWSLIQVDGFLLLIMGTLIFNKLLRLDWMPCVPAYPDETVVTVDEGDEEEEDEEEDDFKSEHM